MYWVISIDYINENPYATWDRYQPILPLSFKGREREGAGGRERDEKSKEGGKKEKKRRACSAWAKNKDCQSSPLPQSLRSGLLQHFHVKDPQMDTPCTKGSSFNWILSLGWPVFVVVVIDLKLRRRPVLSDASDTSETFVQTRAF